METTNLQIFDKAISSILGYSVFTTILIISIFIVAIFFIHKQALNK